MYVTRPLSHYINFPDSLSTPPEGPNSGYLVIQDQESELTCCFGLCKERSLIDLPFPQNKNLTIRYSSGSGENNTTSYNYVAFIPVLNQPLSSNRYYAIERRGRHKGEAYACSKEEDMTTSCFCRCIKDVKPRPLNPHDTYQQFQIALYEGYICQNKGSFHANSVAPNAFPPYFLRRKGWSIYTKTPRNYELGEAQGLNSALRARLPDINIPVSNKSSKAVAVGKWYCPFMFIKDGTLKYQMENSMFYEMTLEQRWEQIFKKDNDDVGNKGVFVDAIVKKELALVAGKEAVWNERNVVDGAIWFNSSGFDGGGQESVGVSLEIFVRMRWEEGRVGWFGGEEREVRVNRVEEYGGGSSGWRRFGCYVLVERFVLKRMDGSLVMTYDFGHIHQIKSIWE